MSLASPVDIGQLCTWQAAWVPELSLLAWLALAVGAVTVGISKTAIPGASIAIALFAMVLPAKPSTAALLVLLIVGDLFALWFYRRHADWVVLRRLVPPVLAGVAVGALFLANASNDLVGRVIGAILSVVILLGLWQRRRAQRHPEQVQAGQRTAWAQAAFYGSLGGFTTMVANAAGPVMSMYFLAARMPIATFLGTSAWFFFVINLAKVPFAAGLGLFSTSLLAMDLVLIPFVVLGALLGRVIAKRLSQRFFDVTVIVLSIAGAVYLLLR
ncbi:MAG: sulfite exporter TauE/SafE family protein [Beutenbergiaceae bacterium]